MGGRRKDEVGGRRKEEAGVKAVSRGSARGDVEEHQHALATTGSF